MFPPEILTMQVRELPSINSVDHLVSKYPLDFGRLNLKYASASAGLAEEKLADVGILKIHVGGIAILRHSVWKCDPCINFVLKGRSIHVSEILGMKAWWLVDLYN
jgi:hypothetical protein